jgi:hypothetical protein
MAVNVHPKIKPETHLFAGTWFVFVWYISIQLVGTNLKRKKKKKQFIPYANTKHNF